jgi:hypothetical protein
MVKEGFDEVAMLRPYPPPRGLHAVSWVTKPKLCTSPLGLRKE